MRAVYKRIAHHPALSLLPCVSGQSAPPLLCGSSSSLPDWLFFSLSAHLPVHSSAFMPSPGPHSLLSPRVNPLIPVLLLGVILRGMPWHGPARYLLATLYFKIKTAIIVDGHTSPISVEEYGSLVWWELGELECYSVCGGGRRLPCKGSSHGMLLIFGPISQTWHESLIKSDSKNFNANTC